MLWVLRRREDVFVLRAVEYPHRQLTRIDSAAARGIACAFLVLQFTRDSKQRFPPVMRLLLPWNVVSGAGGKCDPQRLASEAVQVFWSGVL